jgi:hypothetical protein
MGGCIVGLAISWNVANLAALAAIPWRLRLG